jgi:hypothetical protein
MSWKENITVHHADVTEEFKQAIIREFIKFIEELKTNEIDKAN